MRLTKPNGRSPGTPSLRAGAPPVHYAAGKPQWLREWIADQGQWCLLTCGHKDNLNDRSMLIIAKFGGKRHVDVFCERCNDFVHVQRLMKWSEYAGITADTSLEPLF